MARRERHGLGAVVFTGLLLGLITLAAADVASYFAVVLLITVCASVAGFYRLFQGSRFFAIAFANLLGVYICVYVFFIIVSFANADRWSVLVAFTLPIASFVGGAWLRRRQIRSLIRVKAASQPREAGRRMAWLAPVFSVGAASFFLPYFEPTPATSNVALLVAMAAIAAVVLAVSHHVTSFLVSTGLLFEAFMEQVGRAFQPAFAFFTMYSLNVIVFAAVYRILDRFTPGAQFTVGGVPADLDFVDSLYFSLITVSTVGYGDVVPAGQLVRALSGVQVMLGLLLLLFGFYEIMSYTRQERGRGRRGQGRGPEQDV